MSFGQSGAFALASGNPIGAAFQFFNAIVSLIAGSGITQLIQKLQLFQSSYLSMRKRGLFGSQVQHRLVKSREIWELIGWAEPAEVPPLIGTIPRGTTISVKDFHPDLNNSRKFELRGLAGANPLRFPDGSWWGSWRDLGLTSAGFPADFIPPIGVDGLHRVDFPPEVLARALTSQPRQYLGPRPLAGDEMAARRAAFAAGGGDVAQVWIDTLKEQSTREGRRVRAWTGAGWLDENPNRELFDEKHSTVWHGGDVGNPFRLNLFGPRKFRDLTLAEAIRVGGTAELQGQAGLFGNFRVLAVLEPPKHASIGLQRLGVT